MFANCCRGGPGVRRRCAASGCRANMPQSGEAQQLFADLKRLHRHFRPSSEHCLSPRESRTHGRVSRPRAAAQVSVPFVQIWAAPRT